MTTYKLTPKNILLSTYNSLILPHINYCILSWGYNSNKIFIPHKKSIRAIKADQLDS